MKKISIGLLLLVLPAIMVSCGGEKAAENSAVDVAPVATSDSTTSSAVTAEKIQQAIKRVEEFKSAGFRGSPTSLVMEVALFADLAKTAKEGLLSNDPQQMKLAGELKRKLGKLQTREFPELRKAFIASIKDKLWEENITVTTEGNTNATVTLVGRIFANNKNIKAANDAMWENYKVFRFKRANYKWIKHDDDYTYFEIKPMADGQVSEKVK